MKNFDEFLERALRSSKPVAALRSLVMDLFSQGYDKESILARFEEARARLREANREADEDAVMDVMDCLMGFCSPHMVLEPTPKTTKT